MITRYGFGALSVPVEVVAATGLVVDDAGVAFELTAGRLGLVITHIHVKAIRKSNVQVIGGIVTFPPDVS